MVFLSRRDAGFATQAEVRKIVEVESHKLVSAGQAKSVAEAEVVVSAQLISKVTAALEKRDAQIAGLEAQIRKLGGEVPAPPAARPTIVGAVKKADDDGGYRDYLSRLAGSSDPSIRTGAMAELDRLDEEAA